MSWPKLKQEDDDLGCAPTPGNDCRARRVFAYALLLACIGGAVPAVIILA